jgi:hypothetical protein
MRLAAALACFVCLAEGFAQSNTALDAIVYPPLARAAQAQGDVLIQGGTVVSGHPLLREAALRGVALLNLPAPQGALLFHFILVDAVLSTRTIEKGDPFDRFFLRILGIPVTKKIRECTESPATNRIDSTKEPIEVWVYGKAHCFATVNYAGTLARS